MLSAQHIKILHLVRSKEYITAEVLAKELGISDRSIRKRIQDINAILKNQDIRIQSKARYGFFMEERDRERLDEYLREAQLDPSIPVTTEERVQFLAVYLLNQQEYRKIEELCDMLFVSKGTLTSALKQAESLYGRYGIQVERRPNYGIRAVGDELDIRKFLCDIFVRHDSLYLEETNAASEEPGERLSAGTEVQEISQGLTSDSVWDQGKAHQRRALKNISRITLQKMKKYEIRFSEAAYQDFVDYIYVAIHRIRGTHFAEVKIDHSDYFEKREYYFIEELVRELRELYPVDWPDEEKIALAIWLIGKNIKGDIEKPESNFVIQSRIDQLVVRMIQNVSAEYKIQFANNLDLRMSLNQHMVPMDIRLRYGVPVENPILGEIKENYKFAFAIASYAALTLEEVYETEVSEDEIGYLALIFALALDKGKQETEKKNVLIVCSSGRGSAQLLMHRFRQEFGRYIDHLYVSDLYALEKFDFHMVDYVITTVTIDIKIPVPILEIHEFMTGEDIFKIRSLLERNSEEFLGRYYRESLFFPDLKAETKEELLKELCERAAAAGVVQEDCLESVLEREALSTTDFGNLTAMPHPNQLMAEETAVVVGITDHPVFWGRNEAQVIFLTLIGKKEDVNIRQFYETTVRFLSDAEAVKELIRNRTYEVLLRLLNQ